MNGGDNGPVDRPHHICRRSGSSTGRELGTVIGNADRLVRRPRLATCLDVAGELWASSDGGRFGRTLRTRGRGGAFRCIGDASAELICPPPRPPRGGHQIIQSPTGRHPVHIAKTPALTAATAAKLLAATTAPRVQRSGQSRRESGKERTPDGHNPQHKRGVEHSANRVRTLHSFP